MEIKVYVMPMNRLLSTEEKDRLEKELPFFRRQRYLREREEKQEQTLCAYGLLRRALELEYGFARIPEVEVAEGGKPYFPGHSDIYFNISHTEGAVLCAIHDHEIGVDIQHHRTPAASLMKAFDLTEEEEFWKIWVCREAIGKSKGKGFAALRCWDEKLEEGMYCLLLDTFHGYSAAVATELADAVCRCQVVTMEEIIPGK